MNLVCSSVHQTHLFPRFRLLAKVRWRHSQGTLKQFVWMKWMKTLHWRVLHKNVESLFELESAVDLVVCMSSMRIAHRILDKHYQKESPNSKNVLLVRQLISHISRKFHLVRRKAHRLRCVLFKKVSRTLNDPHAMLDGKAAFTAC